LPALVLPAIGFAQGRHTPHFIGRNPIHTAISNAKDRSRDFHPSRNTDFHPRGICRFCAGMSRIIAGKAGKNVGAVARLRRPFPPARGDLGRTPPEGGATNVASPHARRPGRDAA
jgi:hypothetical protein